MKNFVELVSGYIVNIDAIYSLQVVTTSNKNALDNWENEYLNIKNWYTTNLPEIEYEGQQLSIDNFDDTETFEKYAKAIHQEIIDRIGDRPDEYFYEYIVITQTGVKITINKEKFDLIYNFIKQNKLVTNKLSQILK